VGLPLAILFADRGLNVLAIDLNEKAIATIAQGKMPFLEQGAEPVLQRVLAAGRLALTTDSCWIQRSKTVIITIGTPVDEFLNPDFNCFRLWIEASLQYLTDDQTLILRSTVYPGTTAWLHGFLASHGKNVGLAYCPERIVQGYAVEELQRLPQIISGTTPQAAAEARRLFGLFAPSIVEMLPMEAEFSKLFANVYRYIQFAVANQFYMIADSAGVNYNRVLEGMKRDYPRLAGLPTAGFAAGPCLFKDTMQLAAFSQNQFHLGHAAMLINEGLVLYLVNQMKHEHKLADMTVGLLGMAFKSNNDDIRSSLSYKLKKVLQIQCREVLTTDPYVSVDPNLKPLDEVLERSDLLVLCAPHSDYLGLDLRGKPVLDVWGFFGI
jgi:UDP-N-acetyl-D-mannosaminuronic acid dehydrogenase